MVSFDDELCNVADPLFREGCEGGSECFVKDCRVAKFAPSRRIYAYFRIVLDLVNDEVKQSSVPGAPLWCRVGVGLFANVFESSVEKG